MLILLYNFFKNACFSTRKTLQGRLTRSHCDRARALRKRGFAPLFGAAGRISAACLSEKAVSGFFSIDYFSLKTALTASSRNCSILHKRQLSMQGLCQLPELCQAVQGVVE
jgi:hypothetical protein